MSGRENQTTWDYRQYASMEEIAELDALTARAAELDAERHAITDRRNRFVNKLINRTRARVLFNARPRVSRERNTNHVNDVHSTTGRDQP